MPKKPVKNSSISLQIKEIPTATRNEWRTSVGARAASSLHRKTGSVGHKFKTHGPFDVAIPVTLNYTIDVLAKMWRHIYTNIHSCF
jgi:hypothetical protein